MKNLIDTLLLLLGIFLKFGELNASGNPGSSSGSGRGHGNPTRFTPGEKHVDRLPREHDQTVFYRGKWVRLWLESGLLVQADFIGMETPTSYSGRRYNYLVRIDELLGHPTVVYMHQDNTLMAVRAPKLKDGNIMEPSYTEWFIVHFHKYYRLAVTPVPVEPIPGQIESRHTFTYIPTSIQLAQYKGNERFYKPGEPLHGVVYPDGIKFCIYAKDEHFVEVEGAFIPIAPGLC